jgi:hypothetical protein
MRTGAGFARVAAAAAMLSLPPAALAQTSTVRSPPSPSSRILWDHDGVNVLWFEVRVDGILVSRIAHERPASGDTYSSPMPLLFPGLHTLVVAACNDQGCAASAPLNITVVSGPIRWDPEGS